MDHQVFIYVPLEIDRLVTEMNVDMGPVSQRAAKNLEIFSHKIDFEWAAGRGNA